MDDWTPQVSEPWLVPGCVAGVVILMEVLVRPRVGRVSLDVMEFCDLHTLRDSARSIWTNIGVTSALLLSVAVGLLQADPIQPFFSAMGHEEQLLNIQLSYNLFSGLALLYTVYSILNCVIYLCYVDPLTNRDAIKFFIANPCSIGNPVLSTIFGSLYIIVALVLYNFGTSGGPVTVIFALAAFIFLCSLVFEVVDKSGFDPSGQTAKSNEWQWPLKANVADWPWFSRKYAKNEKALRVLKKMAQCVESDMPEAASSPSGAAAGEERKQAGASLMGNASRARS